MTAQRPRARTTTWVLLGLVVVAQVALVVWHRGEGSTLTPHQVPVALQGSPVITQPLAQRLDRLPEEPVRAFVVGTESAARESVREGRVAAAVLVDLSTPQDVLLVPTVNDPAMTRLARTLAERVGAPMGRTFVVREVAPAAHPDVSRSTVAVTSGVWIASGFVLAVGAMLLRRRRTSPVPGVRTLALLVAACAGASLVGAAVVAGTQGGGFWAWWAVGLLGMLAAASLTTALDVVLGPVGVAVASTLFVLLAGPLFAGRDPRLLPGFWAEVAPWTLHGASTGLTAALVWFDGEGALRPLLVLVVAVLVGAVALAVAAVASRPTTEDEPRRGERVPWRLRVLAVVVPVAVGLLAAVLVAPATARVVTAAPVPGASETECVPLPKVTTLAQLNRFAGTVRGGAAFQGADVGADVVLQDGRRLWVFGDTLRAPEFRGQRFVRNSMLVLGDGCAQVVLPADQGALIPDRGDGIGYWPMSIAKVQRPGYDLVGVATQRVATTSAPDGAFAFESLGSSMAVFVVPRGKTPQLLEQRDIGPDDKDPARPQWGAAAAVHGGWVYLYGTARPQEKGVFGFSLQVARARPEALLDPGQWRYWDGTRWQRSVGKAEVLVPADQGVSQTLSVFPRDGRWYAVSKRDEFLGSELVIWSAPSPTGPFDDGTTVARIPSNLDQGELRYMPLAHPDLIPDPDTVLVSYSRNNTDVTKVEDDPFLYRPQFLRVPLPR